MPLSGSDSRDPKLQSQIQDFPNEGAHPTNGQFEA